MPDGQVCSSSADDKRHRDAIQRFGGITMLTIYNNGFDRLFNRQASLMDQLFADFEARPRFESQGPKVDIVETEDGYELTAEIPGMTADDVDVTLHDGVLTISGRVEQAEEKEERRAVFRERRQVSFARRFRLGDKVDADKIDASVRNGLLFVSLPKPHEVQPRKIAVKAQS